MGKVRAKCRSKDNINDVFKDLKIMIAENTWTEEQKMLVSVKIMEIMVTEIRNVIKDFNNGKLERFPGDYAKRLADNQQFGRNMPLYDTGALYNTLGVDLSITKKSILITAFSDLYYAELLEYEEASDDIKAYMFMEIALSRARFKIIDYLESRG